jgi:hypothetical protein
MRFQVLTAASMKMTGLWRPVVSSDQSSSSSIGPAKHLPCPARSCISTYFIALGLLITLMMDAISTSETSVNFHETTRRVIPEDSHILTEVLQGFLQSLQLSFIFTEILSKLCSVLTIHFCLDRGWSWFYSVSTPYNSFICYYLDIAHDRSFLLPYVYWNMTHHKACVTVKAGSTPAHSAATNSECSGVDDDAVTFVHVLFAERLIHAVVGFSANIEGCSVTPPQQCGRAGAASGRWITRAQQVCPNARCLVHIWTF